MSRIRTIKPEFFTSRSLARCTRDARITFEGLWCEADDLGRGIADARILKGAIWPLDDDVTHVEVEDHLAQLERTGHVRLYEVDEQRYYEVVEWEHHQSPAFRRGEARYPVPPGKRVSTKKCKEVQGSALLGTEIGNREVDREAARVTDASASSGKQRGTTAPNEFIISPELKEWASMSGNENVDLDFETQKFLDHHVAKGSTFKNWDRAWQLWVRQASKWERERQERQGSSSFQRKGQGPVTRSRKDVATGDVRAYRDTGQDDLADALQAQIDAGELD